MRRNGRVRRLQEAIRHWRRWAGVRVRESRARRTVLKRVVQVWREGIKHRAQERIAERVSDGRRLGCAFSQWRKALITQVRLQTAARLVSRRRQAAVFRGWRQVVQTGISARASLAAATAALKGYQARRALTHWRRVTQRESFRRRQREWLLRQACHRWRGAVRSEVLARQLLVCADRQRHTRVRQDTTRHWRRWAGERRRERR